MNKKKFDIDDDIILNCHSVVTKCLFKNSWQSMAGKIFFSMSRQIANEKLGK